VFTYVTYDVGRFTITDSAGAVLAKETGLVETSWLFDTAATVHPAATCSTSSSLGCPAAPDLRRGLRLLRPWSAARSTDRPPQSRRGPAASGTTVPEAVSGSYGFDRVMP
jgi:hypothetical protein